MVIRSLLGGSALVLFTLFLLPSTAAGHALGSSFEQVVGEHLVDVGYTPENFSEGASALFEFELWEYDESLSYEELRPIAYDDVWVRITKGNKTMFASGIYNAEFGGARMTYVFPEPGEYELSVRYEQDLNGIAEATFPLSVAPREGSGAFRIPAMAGLLGLLLGAGGVYFLRR